VSNADYLAGKALAEHGRQTAHSVAKDAFEKQRADIDAAHAANYVKCRDKFDAAKNPPDLKPAFDALGSAVEKADLCYHNEMNKLGREHGVGVRQEGRP
jgi:hypothetical protein